MQYLSGIVGGLIRLGPILVGLVFVSTGVMKAISPHTFSAHLLNLAWIPRYLVPAAVTVVAGFEVGWGVALIIDFSPGVFLPATILVLILFSAVTWWAVRSGQATDCGCYGGYFQPSVPQSLALNAVFCVLAGSAWFAGARASSFALWQLLTVVGSCVAAIMFTEFSQRVARKTGEPLIDTNPMKIGRTWRDSWAGGVTMNRTGEILVSFLGTDCPYCLEWVRVANAIAQSPKLPEVVGVTATSRERLDDFITHHGIRFPVGIVSRSLMGRLIQAVPTTVLVKNGMIEKLWAGTVPPDFVDRFRRAFFPDSVIPSEAPREAPPVGAVAD